MEKSVFNRIVGIVKEMNAQGVTKTEIVSNLKQMGLNDEDIEDIIAAANPETTVADVSEKADQAVKLLESGEHLKPAMEKLGEHGEHFERIHAHLNEIHEKNVTTGEDTKAIREELADLKREVDEIKPLVASIKRLNEDLIKINKKMLTRLDTK
ncbi:MAG: hypothetical protein J7L23_03355 [Candidatus Diapherotrites archaeon]|nr:hypothetical protein [Candidatus Diapherotrites archaeon]